MSFCKICQEEINADSQYINGYWYHNNCIEYLQEENERLKENAIHNDKVVDKARWNEMIYKSRNEKAIEYLPEIRRTPSYELDEKIDNLENILQGEDKE